MSQKFCDGDVVWVKCGPLHWPALVVDFNNLPEDVKEDFPEDSTRPTVIAKYFGEDGYEYLFDLKNIFKYNCDKKEEFIKKGLAKSKNKSKEGATSGWFMKFPKDVIESEKLTGGDENILDKEPFVDKPSERINYKAVFGPSQPAKVETPKPVSKKRKAESPAKKTPQASSGKKMKEADTPQRPIIHPRFKDGGTGSDHQVKILPQPGTPYHIDLQEKVNSSPSSYTCHICGFAASRINVIILHSKTHSDLTKNNTPAGQKSKSSTPQSKLSVASPSTSKGKKKVAPSPATIPKPTPASPAKKGAKSAPENKPDTPAQSVGKSRALTIKPEASPSIANESPRGRRIKTPTVKTSNPPASSSSPIQSTSRVPKSPAASDVKTKKPRMTKKKKDLMIQEKEKKEEERQKILGGWSGEEEGEVEERKRINRNLGKSSDDDDDSDVDSDQNYLGDDHIHGYDDDDDDEEEEPMEIDEPKEEASKPEPVPEIKTNGKKVEETEKKESEEAKKTADVPLTPEKSKDISIDDNSKADDSKADNSKADDLQSLDIDKVLAETSVPTLSSDIENVVKKSVKFSPNLSKDIAFKTMRVMQSESNLTDPFDVDDEFAFSEEPKIPELMATKTILKKGRSKVDSPFKNFELNTTASATSSPASKTATVKLTFTSSADDLSDEEKETKSVEENGSGQGTSAEADPDKNAPTSTAAFQEPVKETRQMEQSQTHLVLETEEGQQIQVHNGDMAAAVAAAQGGNADGETFYLLVDDENGEANLDSLNSQTLYIDSNSLANGDLSNVVLMTDGGESGENQVVAFQTNEANQLVLAGNSQTGNQTV